MIYYSFPFLSQYVIKTIQQNSTSAKNNPLKKSEIQSNILKEIISIKQQQSDKGKNDEVITVSFIHSHLFFLFIFL